MRELEIATGKVSEVLRLKLSYVQDNLVAAAGNRLYVADWANSSSTVFCYDLDARKLDRELTVGTNPIWSLLLSSDGTTSGCDRPEGDRARDRHGHGPGHLQNSIPTNPDSSDGADPGWIATRGTHRPTVQDGGKIEQAVTFFPLRGSGEPETWPTTLKGVPIWIATSHDGRLLAVSDGSEAVEFYDVPSKKLLRRFTHDYLRSASGDGLRYRGLSPNGATLVTTGGEHVLLWDVASGKFEAQCRPE